MTTQRLALSREELAALVAEAERRLAALGDVQRRLAALRVRTASRDRALTIALGPGGALVDVTFHEDAHRGLTAAELGKLVLDTVEAARRDYAARTEEIMAPIRVGAALPIDEIIAGAFDPTVLPTVISGAR